MGAKIAIHGHMDGEDWVSNIITLSQKAVLEVMLPTKGRLVIKKAENIQGPWPKALVTSWADNFSIRLYPKENTRYLQVITTDEPTSINLITF